MLLPRAAGLGREDDHACQAHQQDEIEQHLGGHHPPGGRRCGGDVAEAHRGERGDREVHGVALGEGNAEGVGLGGRHGGVGEREHDDDERDHDDQAHAGAHLGVGIPHDAVELPGDHPREQEGTHDQIRAGRVVDHPVCGHDDVDADEHHQRDREARERTQQHPAALAARKFHEPALGRVRMVRVGSHRPRG